MLFAAGLLIAGILYSRSFFMKQWGLVEEWVSEQDWRYDFPIFQFFQFFQLKLKVIYAEISIYNAL